jgi:hypothetical protein
MEKIKVDKDLLEKLSKLAIVKEIALEMANKNKATCHVFLKQAKELLDSSDIEIHFISKELTESEEKMVKMNEKSTLENLEDLKDLKVAMNNAAEKTYKGKELNLCELLKDCIGMKFYMPTWGEVQLMDVTSVLMLIDTKSQSRFILNKNGIMNGYEERAETCVFPSKEQRDWYMFKPPWVPKQGERVWVSYEETTEWYARYFNQKSEHVYYCFMQDEKTEKSNFAWTKCLPFDQIPW